MTNKVYLGDAVYACFDGDNIILTTEDGSNCPTNTIVMEPQVVQNLFEFVQQLKKDF